MSVRATRRTRGDVSSQETTPAAATAATTPASEAGAAGPVKTIRRKARSYGPLAGVPKFVRDFGEVSMRNGAAEVLQDMTREFTEAVKSRVPCTRGKRRTCTAAHVRAAVQLVCGNTQLGRNITAFSDERLAEFREHVQEQTEERALRKAQASKA